MFRSCSCRITKFWECHIALSVVKCILTLASIDLFFQLVWLAPVPM